MHLFLSFVLITTFTISNLYNLVLIFQMSGQKYIRTSFEEDECSAGTMSPVRDAYPSVMFRGSLTAWQKTTILERVLCMLLFACLIAVIILACLLAVKQSSSPLPANATINATASEYMSVSYLDNSVWDLIYICHSILILAALRIITRLHNALSTQSFVKISSELPKGTLECCF